MDEDKIEKIARKQEERANKIIEYSEKMTRKQEERVSRILEKAERDRQRGPSLLGNLVLLALFNLLVVGMVALTLFFSWNSYTLTTQGEKTSGHVVALSEHSDDEGCCTYAPVVEFTVGGFPVRFEGNNSSDPPAYRVGQEVEVLYLPNNPSKAGINSFSELWMTAVILAPVTLGLFVVLNWVAIAKMRSGRPLLEDSDD